MTRITTINRLLDIANSSVAVEITLAERDHLYEVSLQLYILECIQVC